MCKILIAAAALAVLAANTGCATAFASETLMSELVNDHEVGTRAPRPQAPMDARAQAQAFAEAAPAGASCRYGSDCRSSLCEENICTRTTLEEGNGAEILGQLVVSR